MWFISHCFTSNKQYLILLYTIIFLAHSLTLKFCMHVDDVSLGNLAGVGWALAAHPYSCVVRIIY